MTDRFTYYDNLTRRQQRIYDASDAITEVPLTSRDDVISLAEEVRLTLETARRARLREACEGLTSEIARQLDVSPIDIRVLAVRPNRRGSEYHGLYERTDDGAPARIDVWMRTAARRQVVAYRTFLRTLLHEVCHHLDYELFKLADSFHTRGFFARESSLLRQVLGEG